MFLSLMPLINAFIVYVLAIGFEPATLNSESFKCVISTATQSGHTFSKFILILMILIN